jgi:hypothetical protein
MEEKVKLSKLNARGFRGVRKEIWLDFESDNKSVVLFGNNGDGKSSFSDALEWFFTDRIAYLQREGCGREDYFNKYMRPEDDTIVQINFNDNCLDSQKILKRRGGSSFSNTSEDFKEYIGASSKDSFILRHHTMREFIDRTKKDKLEKVEEIIGFEVVKDCRDNLLKAVNSLKDDRELNSLHGQLNERKRDLVDAVGTEIFGEIEMFNCANQIAKQCDTNLAISNMSDFESVCQTLENKVKSSDRGKQLSTLDNIIENSGRLLGIRDLFEQINKILIPHNELAKQQQTIKASAIEKLYKAAIEAIKNELVKSGECPICKKPVDTESLLMSLNDEVEEIKKILKERNEIIQNAKTAKTKVTNYKVVLNSLLEDKESAKFLVTEIIQRLKDVFNLLLKFEQTLGRVQESPDAVCVPEFLGDMQNFEEDVKEMQQGVIQSKEVLKETDEERKFYQNVNKLKKLWTDYSRYSEINKSISIYNKQINSLKKICQDFENMERENVQKVLKNISSDVNDFIRFIHPDDSFDEVELIPTAERGIEFRFKYHGMEISPPMKILSEAHLNSFGICVFLASAKHFNKTNGFLVLDDVVTSFDSGHRRPLARLLSEKFAETQFLLFTHDDLWFSMLKEELPSGKWIFKELRKWTKDNGIDIKDSPLSLKERIGDCLKENDISGAANKGRTLIEEILKTKCEELGIKGLEFRKGSKNDEREASELINALVSYLKDNQTLRDRKSKKAFNHLRASQLIANIGSHHRTLGSTTLSRGDIETTLRDINEFESLFVCSNCKKEASIKHSPRNSKLKQCECGELKI